MKPLKAIKSPKKQFVPLVSTKAFNVNEDDAIFVVKVPKDYHVDQLDGVNGDLQWIRGSGAAAVERPLGNSYVLRNAAEEAMRHQIKCLVPSDASANGYCSGPAIAAVLSVVKGSKTKSRGDIDKLKETIQKLIPPDPRVPVPNAKVYLPTGVKEGVIVRESERNGSRAGRQQKRKATDLSNEDVNGHAPKMTKQKLKKKKKRNKRKEKEKNEIKTKTKTKTKTKGKKKKEKKKKKVKQ